MLGPKFAHFSPKLAHVGPQFTAKPRDIRFCCMVLALLYRFGDGFRLGAVHAGGFEGARGLEGVQCGGSHARDFTCRENMAGKSQYKRVRACFAGAGK